MSTTYAIILAAGRGTRMNTEVPKILLKIGRKSILERILRTLTKADIPVILVVGYKADIIKSKVEDMNYNIQFARQDELLGTAHSLQVGLKKLPKDVKNILVLFGDDTAMFKVSTIKKFINHHIKNNNMVTFLVSTLDSPNPIGGLELDKSGKVKGILRQSQIVANKMNNYPVLAGGFCFDKVWIEKNIKEIPPSDLSGEYPLPYIYQIAIKNGVPADTFFLKNKKEWQSINTQQELQIANDQLKRNGKF